MISCLTNYIGIRGIAGYENPDSGYFINDLEGITTEQMEEISDNTDHYEPRLAWVDIYNRSSRLLENDIKTAFKKYFKNYSLVDNSVSGYYDDKEVLTAGANYNGWYFDLSPYNKNLTLNFTSIDLYLEAAATFTIYVWDLATGKQLTSIGFNGTEGHQTYRINLNYPLHRYQKIFIAYKESEVPTIKATDYQIGSLVMRRGTIPTASSQISTNFVSGNTGLILNYNIECSIDNFVCQRLDWFKDAFLYKLGIEFCKERIHSDRINRYTLMDRENAMELKLEFEKEYLSLIDNAVRDIKVEDDGMCFECNRLVSYKLEVPA